MREREDIVVALVSVAPNGRLTSRVRLQKTVYLLERLGFGSGFAFDYHHYGPYSRELDNAMADAVALKRVSEQIAHRFADGASYSIFSLAEDVDPVEDAYGTLGRARAGVYVAEFANTNVTILELAATVDFLWHEEKVKDWRAEVGKRKGAKVGGGRLERAVELLKSLGLDPPEPSASRAA